MKYRNTAIEIFLAGVDSVKPNNLIERYISKDQNRIQIEKNRFNLSSIKNIYVVGAGKASAVMAQSIESILGDSITSGHIITKYHHSVPLKFIKLTEAGHPVPDENGINGTEQILSLINMAGEGDLVIVLISGGGSALLADVPEGCTLEDLKNVNTILLQSGANISEVNCIRKHLSKVKGGLLARAAFPAKIVSLILSDVIGDPLDTIASGPTAPDSSTFADAISIIKKYGIENTVPRQIYRVLKEGLDGIQQETLKKSDKVFLSTKNVIIGNNTLALRTAKEKAISFGYETIIITNKLAGDVNDVATYIFEITKSYQKKINKMKFCLLFGGETTVKLKGNGLGGRNQHLALIFASLIKNHPEITFLSAGTDGTDGPTDAAGAVVDTCTLQNASNLNLNIEEYLNNFNSFNFFNKEGGWIKTGPTQTNVMDLMIVLINI